MAARVGKRLRALADMDGVFAPAADQAGPPEEEEHALDALVAPSFGVSMFLLQMVLHLFWPLSLVVYPSSRYPRGARNQNLDLRVMLRAPLIITFTQLGPLLCWGLLATYLAFPRQFRRSSVTLDEIFFIPMVMLAARLVAVGIKYATLSRVELSRFMHASPEQGDKFMNQMQLLSGFLFLRDDVVERELLTAELRHGVRRAELRFDAPPPGPRGPDGGDPNEDAWACLGAECRSFDALARTFYRKAQAATPLRPMLVVGAGVAVSVVASPLVARAAVGERVLGGSPLVLACWALAAALTVVNVFVTLLFLAVGVVHDYRRHVVLQLFAHMLRPPEMCPEDADAVPRLDLIRRPLDAVTWVRGRAVLGSFAFRYERRAEYYLVIVTVVLGCSMIDFFIRLLTGHTKELLVSSTTWALLFMLLLLFDVLVASSFFAALANEECEMSVAALARARLAGRARAPEGASAEELERVRDAEEILATASDQLEIINRVYDARVFGVRADGGMILSFATACVTFFTFIMFLLFDIDAG